VGTKVGRHVTNFPRWMEHVAERMMRREPSRARRLIGRNWRQRRQLLVSAHSDLLIEQDTDVEVTSVPQGPTCVLILRTQVYYTASEALAVKNGNDDDENDTTCSICFGPIENGEEVGALPSCHHTFHSECLKTWLARRQVCPLCQSTDVVERRYNHGLDESI
jgi:hypothetical protein